MISKKILILLTAAILLGILFLGLTPKDFTLANNATWLSHRPGIHIGKYGIAYSDSSFSSERGYFREPDGSLSFEIALESDVVKDERFKFLLVLHNGDDSKQCLIGQWRSSLILMNGDDYNGKQGIKKLGLNEVFQPQKERLLTITSGEAGTKVYVDGQLAAHKGDLFLKIPQMKGKNRLVLGNSVYGRHSWEGNILGLAIYGYALSETDIGLHYQRWSKEKDFRFAEDKSPMLLYTFDEKQGEIASNRAGANHHLIIPAKMKMLEREILEMSWQDVELSRSKTQDIIFNIAGFLPLGFILHFLFVSLTGFIQKRAFFLSVSFSFSVSLIIEIAQSWLPSRSSSLLDLILNTLGALLGAMCFRFYRRFSAKGSVNSNS